MTGINEPDPQSVTRQGEEEVRTPRNRRQPLLAVLAIAAILVLVLALVMSGGG
ncbi:MULTISPECIES: hypothetical protein [unclassified Dietzia]|uniref:hypothetical protein n=1 Tax=unclassified Dietzia TaxID=2617939 RepID=UPI0012E8778E|nr:MULTISPECIES: hypothetical protein [unclassified Dietzia]MBB1025699.1 hypothetical protein [Dietzia sp. DQ12-76]MBB1026842.1 hypothetical protein [Dietzia sp. DQ11-38-2]QGW25313.1 hypothetical protein GJR88_03523 [Dietzia sp. DQ12-45-1b]